MELAKLSWELAKVSQELAKPAEELAKLSWEIAYHSYKIAKLSFGACGADLEACELRLGAWIHPGRTLGASKERFLGCLGKFMREQKWAAVRPLVL